MSESECEWEEGGGPGGGGKGGGGGGGPGGGVTVIARTPYLGYGEKQSSLVAWPRAHDVEGVPFMIAGAPCLIAGPIRAQGCHEPNWGALPQRGHSGRQGVMIKIFDHRLFGQVSRVACTCKR